MPIRDKLRVAELFTVDEEPDPRGYRRASTEIFRTTVDRNDPPEDELKEYWNEYENNPIVQQSIDSFAREVVEPGWYIEADSEETDEELTEWLKESAMIEGEQKENFTFLLKKIVVQREVRGTVLIEKVRGRQTGKIVGFLMYKPEEFKVYTLPGSNMLLPPDAHTNPAYEVDEGDIKLTENDEAAAYVQFDTNLPVYRREKRENEVRFTRDEIIHMTRAADVGEVFGTSRIEAIKERSDGWRNKLLDNDEAIAQKAYPFWLFKFGSEDNPWEDDDVTDFMEHHDFDNFEPGMKQGVAGDVEVDTVSGDTADIYEALQHDVDTMITGLPMPSFAMGAFSKNPNQFTAQSQENRLRRQIRETRQVLEDKMTNVLMEVAEERDLDTDGLRLKIGRPDQPELQPEDQNVIRYISDSPQGGRAPQQQPSSPDDGGQPERQQQPQEQPGEESVWNADDDAHDVAQLADPRFVSVTNEKGRVSSVIAQILTEARDSTLTTLRHERGDTPQTATVSLQGVAQAALQDAKRKHGVHSTIEPEVESVVRRTIDMMGQPFHSPRIRSGYTTNNRQAVQLYTKNIEDAVDRMAEDMFAIMEKHIREGGVTGEEWDSVESRIKREFSVNKIRNRSSMVSHHQLRKAVETTKLSAYEQHPEIDGVEVINSCSPSTPEVCRQVAGCGGQTGGRARFDSARDIGSQLQDVTTPDALHDGFAPLPDVPPFHFGCNSSIVPVTRSGEEAAEDELEQHRYTEGDTVSTPDGRGVVTGVMTEDFTFEREGGESEEISASPDTPAYIVAVLTEEGSNVYRASDLEMAEPFGDED